MAAKIVRVALTFEGALPVTRGDRRSSHAFCRSSSRLTAFSLSSCSKSRVSMLLGLCALRSC